MLIHKLSIGLTLVLVVYVSAAPVVIEDTKKSSKKKARVPRTVMVVPRQRHTSRPKEPWEINQKIIAVKGVLENVDPNR